MDDERSGNPRVEITGGLAQSSTPSNSARAVPSTLSLRALSPQGAWDRATGAGAGATVGVIAGAGAGVVAGAGAGAGVVASAGVLAGAGEGGAGGAMSLGVATPSSAAGSGPTSGPRTERPGVLGSSSPQLSSRPHLPSSSPSPTASVGRAQGSAGSGARPQASGGSTVQSSGTGSSLSASGHQIHGASAGSGAQAAAYPVARAGGPGTNMTENSGSRASKRPHTANSGAEAWGGGGAEEASSLHLLGSSAAHGKGNRFQVQGEQPSQAHHAGNPHSHSHSHSHAHSQHEEDWSMDTDREAGARGAGGGGLAGLRQTLSGLQHTLSSGGGAPRDARPEAPGSGNGNGAEGASAFSDRFIPSRSASNWCSMRLWEAQAGEWPADAAGTADAYGGPDPWGLGGAGGAGALGLSQGRSSLGRGSRGGGGTENSDDGSVAAAYSLLLKSELLGLGSGPASGGGISSRVPAPAMLGSAASAFPGEAGYPGVGGTAGARWQGGALPALSSEAGGGSGRNMLRFRSRGGPLQSVSGGWAGLAPGCAAGGGSGGGDPGMASWLGHCDAPLSLSPLGSDAEVASSATAPFLSPSFQRRKQRKIARSPYKVLDAPALQDDFYLNLVDWSSQNVLAVGLGSCCYLWSAVTSKVTKLCDVGASDSVCSVSWTHRGTFLSVGTSNGDVQIWDVARGRKLRSMGGHRTRVGALSWSATCLASGSRDHSILLRDIRAEEDFSLRLHGHRSEVCGLKWSPDERELASGGNDNQLLVWSAASSLSQQPLLRFPQHSAAVKAIAWSPHQHGLLASGGGTADRCVRFWSTSSGTSLSWVDTGSQVCNLAWSQNANELVSTHGYSQNQIVVWRYPSMSKLATLTGHTMRVLFLAVSPDGQTIVTGAGDETLRFWNVFPGPKADQPSRESAFSSTRWVTIR